MSARIEPPSQAAPVAGLLRRFAETVDAWVQRAATAATSTNGSGATWASTARRANPSGAHERSEGDHAMNDDAHPGGARVDDAAVREPAAGATEYADEYAWNDIGIALRLDALGAIA